MRQICVFCEGKTEYNYIQSLNRFLEECDIFDFRFTAKNLGGINKNNCYSKIKKFKTGDLKFFGEFYAWLDYDVFKRASESEKQIKEQVKKITFNTKSVELLLNHMNGEDFIILHEVDSKIVEWENICNENDHFNKPMHSSFYLPLFKKIIEGYDKGNTPELTQKMIEKCIKNIDDSNIPFKSDIKKILKIILKLFN